MRDDTEPRGTRADLSTDALFTVFSDVVRRAVVVHLRQHGVATLDELVDVIVVASGDEYTGDDRDHIRFSLLHNHLPHLEDHGLVAYDPDQDVVEATDLHEEIGEWLDLAVRRDLQLQRVPRTETQAGSPETIRVLLVDDDPDLAALVKAYVEGEYADIEVTITNSVPEAVSTLEAGSFDCIVSDYKMPALSGLDFLRTVRDEDPTIPFLLFTARGNEATASEAIAAGVTDYVRKGPELDHYDELVERIRSAIDWE